jgi:hypothetical protein
MEWATESNAQALGSQDFCLGFFGRQAEVSKMGDTEVSVRLSQLEKWLNHLKEIEDRLGEIENELVRSKEEKFSQQEPRIWGLSQTKTPKRH